MSSNIWITAANAVRTEGQFGATAFTFTVLRDGDTSAPASADWAVSGAEAFPADAGDFWGGVFPSGVVTFAAGEANKTITVDIVSDTTFEPDEGFKVTLSNPVGGLLGVPTAAGTATDYIEIVDASSATALAMVNKMLGASPGLSIVSAQFSGDPSAAAMYNAVNLGSAGGRTLALGAGVLLTSGDGTPPTTNTVGDYSQENFWLGDAALDAYAATAFTGAGGTADATILQANFTVAPVGGAAPTHVSIDIMFGSEEFPEFSDTSFVDIAAIEIDGINYAYFNQSTQQPLSVIDNNLAVGNFIDNQGNVLAIEYDGISAPLRVVGALNPLLAQHTIRIAIADTGDYSWDSGMFASNLRAFSGSPSSGGISVISQDSANGTILNDDTQIVGTVGFSGTSIYRPLDLMFLHDLSGSFSDDVMTVQALVPDLVTAVRAFQADSRFGVASFVDKPVAPFGQSADYVYRTDLALTADQAQLQATINSLQVLNGNDTPEAQIEALMQLALRTTETGYRTDAMRVAVLMTDAPYHVAGDHSSAPANDGDTELEGSPAGTGEDYPALAQLKAALEAANIVPVFAVTSDVVSSYQSLVSSLGRGVVVPLSSNSSDLVNSLTLGLQSIAANVDQDEGNSGDTPFVFTLTRDGDTSVAASVDWTVAPHGGNPVDTDDLAGAALPSGTASFAAGEVSKTITVNISGDTSIEADEGFRVTLVNPSGLTLRTDSYFADGTVRNDDAHGGGIWITAESALKYEGHSGPTAFTFTVARDGGTGAVASVDWTVTASGTNPADTTDFYGGAFPFGTVSFAPGETSKTITVNVNGDTAFEPDEGFKVILSNASGAVIGTPGTSGTGVVTDLVPITGTDDATALAMASKVLGGASAVTLVSAHYSGSVNAASLFDGVNLGSAGGSTLALGAGVLLTSGDGTPALSNTQTGYTQTNSVPGDTALDGYAHTAFSGAGTTLDATVLDVTFTVAAPGASAPTHVSIDLMFGSDEYPEYSDSSYVDIAAIEIDGVNYAYFNQSTQQPLSVISNNLAVGNFIDNQGNVLAIEYDGISAPLRVVGALNTSLAQHTIRIAIADTGDSRLDSGVFVSNLRAFSGSPSSGGISVISQDSAEASILNDDNPPGVVVPGSSGDDTETGTPGDDDLGGLEGDDIFIPGLGNDSVDGGPGTDKVRLPLFPNQFHFTATGANKFSVGYMTFTMEITDVEYVEFGTLYRTRVPIIDMLSGKVQDNFAKLTDLYIAFFGRAPDVGGLEYWQEHVLEFQWSVSDIARHFSWSDEARALFPSGSSNREFVRTVYLNCFGREPDEDGWDYWTAELDKLDPSDPGYLNDRGTFVGALLLGAYAPTSGDEDRNLLTNRHEVSMYYANQLVLQPDEGFDTGINDLLKLVNGNSDTQAKAEHVIDHVFDFPVTLTGVMDNTALLATLWAAG